MNSKFRCPTSNKTRGEGRWWPDAVARRSSSSSSSLTSSSTRVRFVDSRGLAMKYPTLTLRIQLPQFALKFDPTWRGIFKGELPRNRYPLLLLGTVRKWNFVVKRVTVYHKSNAVTRGYLSGRRKNENKWIIVHPENKHLNDRKRILYAYFLQYGKESRAVSRNESWFQFIFNFYVNVCLIFFLRNILCPSSWLVSTHTSTRARKRSLSLARLIQSTLL